MPVAAPIPFLGADEPRADGYARRRPEESLLYQVVAAHWPEFRQKAEDAGGLPRFAVREFEQYLRCGILEHGLARLACRRCGHQMVIGFSCKRRRFCPSCCGRRMSDTAAHLVESVLPAVPYRQWVCSLPFALRTAVGFDRRLCADVLEVFIEALLRQLRWRVKRAFGLASVDGALVGAITFIQRFDSALRLDPHFDCLVPDGAWVVGEDGEPRFCALGDPTPEDVGQVAEVGGLNVFAGPAVDGRDRRRLEHLCRYMARPPLGQERLEQQGDGRIRYSLKKPWKNGTHAILLAPLDLIARLCALIPPPRSTHLLHYHGIFSGGSAVRQAIVPGRTEAPGPRTPMPLFKQDEEPTSAPPPPSRYPWAWLLARVFAIDVVKCPVKRCSGEMRLVEIAKNPEQAARILASQGMGARSPTGQGRIPARQLALPYVR